MPTIKIERELNDLQLNITLAEGGGKATVHVAHAGAFELPLNEREVEHAKSLAHRATKGRITFEEGEPADVLALSIDAAELAEQQAQTIDATKEELSNLQRALDNSNELNSGLQNELQDTNHELGVVRNKLKDTEGLINSAAEFEKEIKKQLSAAQDKIKTLETENKRLSSQKEAAEKNLKKIEEELKKEKAKAKETPTNPDAAPQT
jgi:chromosome segregation ATPase